MSSDKPGQLPLKEYLALHSYLSSLLIGSFIFLPHSSQWLLGTSPAIQHSSSDRPEHAFLTPLTSRPLLSMCWDVFGMFVCMAWWSRRLSIWADGKQSTQPVVGEQQVVDRQQKTIKSMQVSLRN